MMRFFLNLLTTVLGVFIAFFFLFLVLVGLFASQSSEPTTYVRDNSILEISLKGSLPERVQEDPIQNLLEPDAPKMSMEMIREILKKAAKDDRIKGVVLQIKGISTSTNNLFEIRKQLLTFKESGKFVYAYTDDMGMDEAGYLVATAADKIMSPPESFFEFDGFYVQGEFYSKLFDKIGVKAEITRYGKYKSAIEPYVRRNFSPESREQLQVLLTNSSSLFVKAVAESRNLSENQVNQYLNAVPDMSMQMAEHRMLIDSLVYPDEFEQILKEKIGLKETSKLRKISLTSYNKAELKNQEEVQTGGKVAVIFAEGIIIPQAPNQFDKTGYLTYSDFEKSIDKALDDKQVKAIVLRVNSPGGSGTTADLMWRKIQKAKEKVPVITSMGSVAASGGYYIAVAADTIFAEPTTITGSIGVFSTKFNLENLAEEKVGIEFDEVKTHQHADWINPFKSFTKEEDSAFQQMVNQFYDTFLNRCDLGRELTKEQIHELSQGRVWSGTDAQTNGLVDVLGNLDDAIAFAAKKGGLDAFETVNYPVPKSFIQQIMEGGNQTAVKILGLKTDIVPIPYFELMKIWQDKNRKPVIHALLPIDIRMN